MAFENKEGYGAMFPNNKQNERQPDYRGDAMYEGKIIKIAGWWKQGSKGEYLSIRVEPKQDAPQQRQQEAPGYDDVPTGTYQANRQAQQAAKAPAAAPEQFFDADPEIPF